MPKRKAKQDFENKLAGHQAKMDSHSKLLPLEEPDVSSILKIAGTGQTEEMDDLFVHPLHSTAISAYEVVEDTGNRNDQYSILDEPTSSLSDSEPPPKNTTKRKSHRTLKTIVRIEDSEEDSSIKNMVSKKKAQSHVNKKVSPEREIDYPISEKVSKQPPKVTGHVTKENVLLNEFEKITTELKQEMKLKKYRKVIDRFHTSFKDQLTNIVRTETTDAEKVKNAKLKQIKMIRKINKKRLHFIEIKEQLHSTELELKQLKKEHNKLKEKTSWLRNAIHFVKDLKSLQQMNDEKATCQEKLEYGISSVPALLMDSQRILEAESHFENINTKLQKNLGLQKN